MVKEQRLPKMEVIKMMNLSSVDELNVKLLEFGEALSKEGKAAPPDLLKPEDYNDLSSRTLAQFRKFAQTSVVSLPEASGDESSSQIQHSPDGSIQSSDEHENQVNQKELNHGQALSTAVDAMRQLQTVNATLHGLTIADETWSILIETISDRTNQNALNLVGSLSVENQNLFEQLKLQISERTKTQVMKLGEATEKLQSYLDSNQELIGHLPELTM